MPTDKMPMPTHFDSPVVVATILPALAFTMPMTRAIMTQ